MSATFKNTNRFLVLMENPIEKIEKIDKNIISKTNEKEQIIQKPEKKFNNFKTDRETIQKIYSLENKQRNEFRKQQEYDTRRFIMEDKIKKAKEEEIKTITNKDNFPELKLVKSSQKENINKNVNNVNFSKLLNVEDSLIKNEKDKEDNEKEECIADGCVCIKFDKKENRHIWLYGKNIIKNQDKKSDNKDEYENPYIVMSRITKLYRRRRNEHIRKWGIDEYEKMFMFPNYDYEYYDKLDEIYEEDDSQYDDYSYYSS